MEILRGDHSGNLRLLNRFVDRWPEPYTSVQCKINKRSYPSSLKSTLEIAHSVEHVVLLVTNECAVNPGRTLTPSNQPKRRARCSSEHSPYYYITPHQRSSQTSLDLAPTTMLSSVSLSLQVNSNEPQLL